MHHLLDPNPALLKQWLTAHGHPAYRGAQVRKWLFERRAKEFGDMTDLPNTLALPAGQTVFANITAITLTSGSVITYAK